MPSTGATDVYETKISSWLFLFVLQLFHFSTRVPNGRKCASFSFVFRRQGKGEGGKGLEGDYPRFPHTLVKL